ncbi:hypothetical protein FNW02_17570 [Komarekiella sp. 'clone 1']|uniref:Uncharacterized protein n=1 Tax=Komarekiella delphini-convector SJRDD-AB1 TaxID=2593771 RepID=A0AA40SYZ6_9NOST|nr:hypothetical protein [Komarekiella delphini-convector]MBD6617587.1 hypothetical protein [Komarekiella delphini-convector SJRDD-AB1]
MKINLTKRLFVLINILLLSLFLPRITLAAPVQLHTNSGAIFAQAANSVKYSAASADLNLTPQQRQQLQAVRQRRNKEISAVLNSSQRAQLAQKLRGNNIYQALETLKLQPNQQELVDAIVQFTNLKMKAILSRYSLQVGQK